MRFFNSFIGKFKHSIVPTFISLLSLIGFFFMKSGAFLQIEEAEYDLIIKPSESKKIQEKGGRGKYVEARSGRVSLLVRLLVLQIEEYDGIFKPSESKTDRKWRRRERRE